MTPPWRRPLLVTPRPSVTSQVGGKWTGVGSQQSWPLKLRKSTPVPARLLAADAYRTGDPQRAAWPARSIGHDGAARRLPLLLGLVAGPDAGPPSPPLGRRSASSMSESFAGGRRPVYRLSWWVVCRHGS